MKRLKLLVPVLILLVLATPILGAKLFTATNGDLVECVGCAIMSGKSLAKPITYYACEDKPCTLTVKKPIPQKVHKLKDQDIYNKKYDKKADGLFTCFLDGSKAPIKYIDGAWYSTGDYIQCKIGCNEPSPGKASCIIKNDLKLNSEYFYCNTRYGYKEKVIGPYIIDGLKVTSYICEEPKDHWKKLEGAANSGLIDMLNEFYDKTKKDQLVCLDDNYGGMMGHIALVKYEGGSWHMTYTKIPTNLIGNNFCTIGCQEPEHGKAQCFTSGDTYVEIGKVHFCNKKENGYKVDTKTHTGKVACTNGIKYEYKKPFATFELTHAKIDFKEKDQGIPYTITALKDTKVKQNINGYKTHMAKDDRLSFYSTGGNLDISSNRNPNSFYYFAHGIRKASDGTIEPLEVCGEKFPAVAGELLKDKSSSFNIERVKVEGGKPKCQIIDYRLFNMKDAKADQKSKGQTPYYYKCGDITFGSYGDSLNSLVCEPKLEVVPGGKGVRTKRSLLLCKDSVKQCKQTYFWFGVHSQKYPMPLNVLLMANTEKAAEKTAFKHIRSTKEINTPRALKFLQAKEFYAGAITGKNYGIRFKPKPKLQDPYEVTFLEDEYPRMYVPNGIDMDFVGPLNNQITFRYVPEFSKQPPKGIEFQGFYFRFNAQIGQPTVIYPTGIKRWDPKRAIRDGAAHYGLVPRAKHVGGYTQVNSNGKTYKIPKLILVEWRVNPDDLMQHGSASKETGSIQCRNPNDVRTMRALKSMSLSDFAMSINRYSGDFAKLSKPKQKAVQSMIAGLIKANAKDAKLLKGKYGGCNWKDCSGPVVIELSTGQKSERSWSQKAGKVIKGDKIKVPCNALVAWTRGKAKVRYSSSIRKSKAQERFKKITASKSCASSAGPIIGDKKYLSKCLPVGIEGSSKYLDMSKKCQKDGGQLIRGHCPGLSTIVCCGKVDVKHDFMQNKPCKSSKDCISIDFPDDTPFACMEGKCKEYDCTTFSNNGKVMCPVFFGKYAGQDYTCATTGNDKGRCLLKNKIESQTTRCEDGKVRVLNFGTFARHEQCTAEGDIMEFYCEGDTLISKTEICKGGCLNLKSGNDFVAKCIEPGKDETKLPGTKWINDVSTSPCNIPSAAASPNVVCKPGLSCLQLSTNKDKIGCYGKIKCRSDRECYLHDYEIDAPSHNCGVSGCVDEYKCTNDGYCSTLGTGLKCYKGQCKRACTKHADCLSFPDAVCNIKAKVCEEKPSKVLAYTPCTRDIQCNYKCNTDYNLCYTI